MPSGMSLNKELALSLRRKSGLVPCMWLGDPRLNQFAADHFPDTVVLDLNTLRFGRSSSETISRDIWESARQYWESAIFEENRPALLEEFARYADGHFARHMDRELILRNIHLELLGAIFQAKPSFMIASETPHNPVFLSMFFLLRWLRVPCLFFQPTTSVAPALLPRTWIDETFTPRPVPEYGQSPLPPYIKNFTDSAISGFKSGDGSLRQRWQTRQNLVSGSKKVAQAQRVAFFDMQALKAVVRRAVNRKPRDPFKELLERKKIDLLAEFSHLTDSQEKAEGPSALFALHFQPERTSVPEGGSESYFQAELVMQARSLLPFDTALLVKEHPTQVMVNKHGHLGRSPLLYSFLQQLPNTFVLGEGAGSNALIRSSEAIFTITGTIGVEAALAGVPAIYFGHPWWAGLPGTVKFDSSLSFSDHLELCSAEPGNAEAELRRLFKDRIIPGVGTPSQEAFWMQQEGMPASFQKDMLASVIRVTNAFWLEKVGPGGY